MILHKTKDSIKKDVPHPEADRYIDYLDQRIAALCSEILRSEGPSALAGMPCPPPAAMIPGLQLPKAQSSKDRIQRAEDELLESLGRFDEMLAEEQQKVLTSRSRAGGNGLGEPGSGASGQGPGSCCSGEEGEQQGSGDEGTEGPEGRSEAGNQGEQAHSAHSGGQGASNADPGAETGHGAGQTQKGKGKAAGIAGGRQQKGAANSGEDASIYEDDDIVARQLREAAEKETDPELKKRLWEEYRRYKEANR